MKATVVVHAPGPPDVLTVEDLPVPEVRDGWILVRVRAFGLNRSELVTRRGGSGNAVTFPRVLGIEAVGEVVSDPSGDVAEGRTFVAAMGEMGRAYDGGYEQYALLPASQVIPVETTLDWPTLGAIPRDVRDGMGLTRHARPRSSSSEGVRSMLAHPGSSDGPETSAFGSKSSECT